MSENWDRTVSINNSVDILERATEIFTSEIERTGPTGKRTSLGQIDLRIHNITSFGITLKILPRTVIYNNIAAKEYNVVYEDPIDKKRSIVFQFYLTPIGNNGDYVVSKSASSDDSICTLNNQTEKDILERYHSALLKSPALNSLS